MTELSGKLAGIGLPAIVRFLRGLKTTGCLGLTQDEWSGQVEFVQGDVTNATLASRTGLARLDQGAERAARAGRRLPRPDAVPVQVEGDGGADEPLPLDRGSLQTLLTVDGHRSVREIVAMRHSIEPLWHLAALAEAGLIGFNEHIGAPIDEPAMPVSAPPSETTVVMPRPASTTPLVTDAADTSPGRCPKLGFEDDPSSSFSRPTRLHRCFAAGTSLPLSLDQQRDLCLSDQFRACPRLSEAQTASTPGSGPGARHVQPATNGERRIVRLPIGARPFAADREEVPNPAGEPTPLRPGTPPARETAAASATRPTPFRARLERPSSVATATMVASARRVAAPAIEAPRETPDGVPPRPAPPPPAPRREPARPASQPEPPSTHDRWPIRQIPVLAIAGAGIAVLLVAAVGWLLGSQLFGDSSLDSTTLPNARLVEAGTPVSALATARGTPVAAPTDVPSADADAPDATAVPEVATAQQTTPSTAESAAALLDERFTTNDANWPSDPRGLGQFATGIYRIGTQQVGQGAAISAPIANAPADVLVTADFRKLAGPDGGGYGIIVRDQQASGRDGSSQDGQYYVLEVGDKGEVGIWRRDGDHWVDLLPWQPSEAVLPGTAPNELTVRAVGNNLSMSVNGSVVASATDSSFANGRVGVFVGGDGNDVALTRFTVQNP
jgi:hypothetical protein